MACKRCRARKLKCENKDSVAPCKRCEGENAECVFVPVADDTKPPKTGSPSRGTPEDRRSNRQSAPSPSPAQMTMSRSLPNNIATNVNHDRSSQLRGGVSTSHMYYPHPLYSQRHSQPSSTSMTGEQTGAGFSSPHYRGAAFSGLDGPTPSYGPDSVQPEYHSHPNMTSYVNQGRPQPIPSTSPYNYSPPPDPPYSQGIYGPNQQARVTQNQAYYPPGETVHEPHNSQHQQYYLANGHYPQPPQPSGLPGYPDPSIGPQRDNSNFYSHYTR